MIHRVFNSLTGTGAYMRQFFDELYWRLTISVSSRTPTTCVSGYESSAFWLRHRSINHPQSLKCEGAVPLRKCCLEWTFFLLYNIVQYAYFSITNIDHGGRRPHPWRVGTWYGRPVVQKIANGLLYQRSKVWFHESKGVVFKIAVGWGNMDGRYCLVAYTNAS